MHDQMDVLLNDIRPDSCLNEGLDCRTCTHAVARQIATLCPSLSREAAQAIFLEIYRHPACRPMCQAFEWAYLAQVESSRHTAAPVVADAA